ncbi:hypothetical protein CANCADRAFT_105485 [Tortispora caseinolytica NRRL Y-17796]|uniref:Selenoprotein W-like protein n=1 Tax=Tortispora caseinolytica NRRL Y-17796 TaxID=767744 RepID=A0A1E4TF36_9ASCO|nr:hypothetical protein CANCADRAFT_105485 [Tortispora caseinolytica NRRL Y-17796]
MSCKYPRVRIDFCTKCKWNLRAAWYAQELLSTFGDRLGEVAMSPAEAGCFAVHVVTETAQITIWDRKRQRGFPDSKELKQLVRDVIDPGRDLGHVDGHKKEVVEVADVADNTDTVCVDCEKSDALQ